MGGNSGGIIVQDSVKETLTNPVVHGDIPAHMSAKTDPILARESSTWTTDDKAALAHVFSWALVNM